MVGMTYMYRYRFEHYHELRELHEFLSAAVMHMCKKKFMQRRTEIRLMEAHAVATMTCLCATNEPLTTTPRHRARSELLQLK